MNGARRAPRRILTLGLLMPGLLFAQPTGAFAETKPPPRSAQRPVAPKADKPAPTRAAAKTGAGPCMHVMRRGESLSRIALRYRVTRSAVASANHLTKPDALRVGQRLQIPGCRDAGPRRVAEPPTTSASGDKVQLLARVGPRRIATRLYLAVPDFSQEGVAFEWPIDGTVVSGFGRRRKGWHAGVDISAEPGTQIRAAADGTVIFSGFEKYYGRMIRIEHEDGFTSLYAHNLENLVEVGDAMEAGAVIATVGRTGHASAAHLHFEIRRHGVAYNPLHLLGHEAPVLASSPTAPIEVTPSEDEEDRE